jgi:hypothetical protein
VPMIPRATLRTVRSASSTNSGPRAPPSRVATAWAVPSPATEWASRMPARTIATTKLRMPKPAPATSDSSQTAATLSCGEISARAVLMLLMAWCQNWLIGGPTKGSVASRAGGGGMAMLPSASVAASAATLSTSSREMMVKGTIRTTSARRVTRKAASPPRPPSQPRSRQ